MLNEGGSSEIQGREEEAGGEKGLLNEGITREEVEQTLVLREFGSLAHVSPVGARVR